MVITIPWLKLVTKIFDEFGTYNTSVIPMTLGTVCSVYFQY